MSKRARSLRKNLTDAERKLWRRLRSRQLLAYKFRRQFPIGPYVVDFVCLERRLIVEVDGGQHAEQRRRDEKRAAYLREQGFRVDRFWNNQVLNEMEGVVAQIGKTLETPPSPQPSPAEGRGSDSGGATAL